MTSINSYLRQNIKTANEKCVCNLSLADFEWRFAGISLQYKNNKFSIIISFNNTKCIINIYSIKIDS